MRYFGASPAEDSNPVTAEYVNSLGLQNLSDADLKSSIRERFAGVTYATASWADSVINSTLTGQAFVRRSNLTSAFSSKIPILLPSQLSRANGPIRLDVSGKVSTTLLTGVASTQKFPRLHWSPSSYPLLSNISAETNLCTVVVDPSPLGSYRVFVTGTINAQITADEQYPVVRVRANHVSTGQVVATGYGLAESHGGGTLTTYSAAGNYIYTIPGWATKIDVVLIGGGGGGINAPIGFGGGGGAGGWAGRTIVKSELPINTTTFQVSVGGGAEPQNFNLFPSAYGFGGNTVCVVPGTGNSSGTLTGEGGKTGNNQVALSTKSFGSGAENYPFGKNTYIGSLDQTSAGARGNSPGGGGAGGNNGPGGPGGDGAAFLYAYIDDDTNYGQVSIIPEPMTQNSPVLTGPTTLYVNLLRGGNSGTIKTQSLNSQISVMVVPA